MNNLFFTKSYFKFNSYNRVLAICVLHGNDTNYDLFHTLNKSLLEKYKYKFILKEITDIYSIKNNYKLKDLVVPFKHPDILEYFNHDNIELTDDELVLPLLFIRHDHLDILLKMSYHLYDLDNYNIIMQFVKYFGIANLSDIYILYKSILQNNVLLENKNISIRTLLNINNRNIITNKNIIITNNYNENIRSQYVNMGNVNIPYIYKNLNVIDNNLVMRMFNQYRDKNNIIKKLLLHPKYFYLMLKNTEMMHLLNLNDHKDEFNIAWRQMVLYEYSVKNKQPDDFFVYDLETANKLPQYERSYCDNPYFVLNDHWYNYNIHLNFDIQFLNVSLKIFITNMSIFICGDYNEPNIFKYIDFSDKFGLTGSIIPACVCNHPYLINFMEEFKDDPKRCFVHTKRYFDYYYANSDIDIMCSTKSEEQYFKDCTYFTQGIHRILNETYKNVKMYSKYIPSIVFFINDDIIKKYNNDVLPDDGKINEKIKLKLYHLYLIERWKHNRKTTIKIPHYKLKDITFFIRNNNSFMVKKKYNSIQNSEVVHCFIAKSLKYKIMTNKTKTFELFMFRYDNFIQMVDSFHLNCVRAYFDGKTVKMLPSFITAMKTLINMDLKFFSSKTTPKDIIWKYFNRGYFCVLNRAERELLPREQTLFAKLQLTNNITKFQKQYQIFL